eukprot:CAMPEP_0194269486 /NCGR_PEP_ID=MMETSP0169-20130528/3629_1 /TAXON_ID=218684 /ORGANISM="Corethron pennatum, Strain L29A3" /LENGTH=487 /DNA_ID=CAMNT_0039011143 /DNA_START=115 /DNA_END=1578 /DNA_ORIENTATION=-
MSLPLQNKSPKKEEQKIPAGLPMDLSAGLPGVAAPGTAAGNTAAAVAAASYSPYEILDLILKNKNRPIRPEGASPPQYVSIAPMGLGSSQSSGPGRGPGVISPGVRPSPQPVTVESSSLVMSSISPNAPLGGSPALSLPVPSGDGGAAWPGSIKYPGRMTPEERRVRKNAQSRARASQMRANIDMMRQKSDLSTDEKNLLEIFEDRRNRKNVRSRQRATEKKAEVERILATPLSKRGDRDINALQVTLAAKRRKNEGDRVRREKIKEENNKKNQVPRQRGRPRKYHPKTGSLQPEIGKSSHPGVIRPKSKGLLPIETEGSSLPIQAAPDSSYQFHPNPGQVPIQAGPNPMFPMNSLAGQVPIQATLGSMYGLNHSGGQVPIQAAPGPMFSMNPATGQMLPAIPPFSNNPDYQMPPRGLPGTDTAAGKGTDTVTGVTSSAPSKKVESEVPQVGKDSETRHDPSSTCEEKKDPPVAPEVHDEEQVMVAV